MSPSLVGQELVNSLANYSYCPKGTVGLGPCPNEVCLLLLVAASTRTLPNQMMALGRMLVEISLVYTCVNLPLDLRMGCLIVRLLMVFWSLEG